MTNTNNVRDAMTKHQLVGSISKLPHSTRFSTHLVETTQERQKFHRLIDDKTRKGSLTIVLIESGK